jgi:hypothetical protein
MAVETNVNLHGASPWPHGNKNHVMIKLRFAFENPGFARARPNLR